MTVAVSELMLLPNSAADICDLADRFIADWLRTALASVEIESTTDATITAVEAAIGAPLPIGLRYAYTALGPKAWTVFRQDPLAHVESLAVDAEDVVTFRREQQGCATWGYARDAGVDPPVLMKVASEAPVGSWGPTGHTVSVHILEGVLSEAALAVGEHTANTRASFDALGALRALPRLGIPPYRSWAAAGSDRTVWHCQPGALVRNDGNAWLWAVARTHADLERLRSTIPGEWEIHEP